MPFSGHGLRVAGVLIQLSLYEVRMLAPRPIPNLEGLVLNLSGTDGPTAGVTSEFTGACKLPPPAKYAFDQVEIPLRELCSC
jgi:hypothetical protein